MKNGTQLKQTKFHTFINRKGQKIIDGKSYYPAYLTVMVDQDTAWSIVRSLIAQLELGGRGKLEISALAGSLVEHQR